MINYKDITSNPIQGISFEQINTRMLRRRLSEVDHLRWPFVTVVHHHKPTASDPSGMHVDDANAQGGCYGSINSRTPFLENVPSHFGTLSIVCGHSSMLVKVLFDWLFSARWALIWKTGIKSLKSRKQKCSSSRKLVILFVVIMQQLLFWG